jgi:hypothetical protein
MPAPHTSQEQPVAAKPTARQLSYLRSLADRTGQTFTYPHTAREASAEIQRLKVATAMSRTERRVETTAVRDQVATGPHNDAPRVRDDEISGHGSSATWTQNREQPAPAADEPSPPARRPPVVGARTELARYRVVEGERIVCGQRVDGVVRVTDRPAGEDGRAYLIERGLETKAELDALVADYVAQAERLGMPPLAARPAIADLETAA